MLDKEQGAKVTQATPPQTVAADPSDLNKMAQNDNPRANENIQESDNELEDPQHDVGSEITDGEDA